MANETTPAKNPEPSNSEADKLYTEGRALLGVSKAKTEEGIAKLKLAAEKGHPDAYFYIAYTYDEMGVDGFKNNLTEAVKYYELAITHNQSLSARYNLGRIFFDQPGNEAKGLSYIQVAADNEVLEAQLLLIMQLLKGHPLIPLDIEKGITLLNSAAQKSLDAKFYLANALSKRNATEPVQKEVTRLLQELVDAKYGSAYRPLAIMYYHDGLEADFEKAFTLFLQAQEYNKDDIETLIYLTDMYTDGTGTAKNIPAAIKCLQRLIELVELGEIRFKRDLGVLHLQPGQDTALGLKLIQECADSGDAKAQYDLGAIYSKGDYGIPINSELAILNYSKAAAQGHIAAGRELGRWRLYQAEVAFRNTPPIDLEARYQLACIQFMNYQTIELAKENFRRCAIEGHSGAKFKIWLFEALFGKEQALEYLQDAAKDNYIPALAELGYLYEAGVDVEQSIDEAAQLYQKAIDLGGNSNPQTMYAQYQLAGLYTQGRGVVKDQNKAKELYQNAIILGYKEAQFELDFLIGLEKPLSAEAKKSIRPIEEKFNQWLEALDTLRGQLNAKNSETYKEVNAAVNQLYETFNTYGKKYFAHFEVNKKSLGHFADHCRIAINEFQPLIETHRGWHANHWLIKWCAGFLAFVTILPALFVSGLSQHGAVQTFFSSEPLATATDAAFDKIMDDLRVLEEELSDEDLVEGDDVGDAPQGPGNN